ncbi:hypothetical protein GCM10010508_32620 [Streptomyces naganishii JCM 4654]|uniref:Uncharacterized protein n=1 Tax=Streptomyces naganishii JCM 4654 TaxID=1306179 RepID=A0A918Y404_9ACTN|nr:hypothetical protein GCM10010508_32620 [Streptomyces naganishii JCM 4654]
MATSTIARYFALSKNGSRRSAQAPPPSPGLRGPGTPDAGDCAGGSGVLLGPGEEAAWNI